MYAVSVVISKNYLHSIENSHHLLFRNNFSRLLSRKKFKESTGSNLIPSCNVANILQILQNCDLVKHLFQQNPKFLCNKGFCSNEFFANSTFSNDAAFNSVRTWGRSEPVSPKSLLNSPKCQKNWHLTWWFEKHASCTLFKPIFCFEVGQNYFKIINLTVFHWMEMIIWSYNWDCVHRPCLISVDSLDSEFWCEIIRYFQFCTVFI